MSSSTGDVDGDRVDELDTVAARAEAFLAAPRQPPQGAWASSATC